MEQTGKTLGDSLQLQGTHGETQESEHETKDSFTHTHRKRRRRIRWARNVPLLEW
jgi:hypothetical protein